MDADGVERGVDAVHWVQVLKLCLGEILKCQYFVSMLGNRYGWCHDSEAEDAVLTKTFAVAKEEFPQFANIIDRSVVLEGC